MIHIITNIFGRDDWLNIQAAHLEKYSEEPYKVHCFLDDNLSKSEEGNPPIFKPGGDTVNYRCYKFYKAIGKEHYDQANEAVNRIIPGIEDDDTILFLDCDAFPCDKNWQKVVRENLSTHDITAVVMRENWHSSDDYNDIPHLCFFATTKQIWEENSLEWGLAGKYQNPQRGMLDKIAAANLTVKEINRTNEFNAHRVCFGVYGDIVYHQACGIRGFEGSVCEGADVYLRYRKFGLEFKADSDMALLNSEIWMAVWKAIKEDKTYTFVRRYFMGRP